MAWGLMCPGVWAAQLKDFTSKDEDKKILLHFAFSAPVVVDDEYYYDKNLVLLRVKDCTFTREQLRQGYKAPENLTDFLHEVTYQQDKSEGQIRIYLGKLVDPSDALVVKYDDRVEIEVLKPTWKEPPPKAEPTAAPETPANPPETEPEAEPAPEPAPADITPPQDATFRGDQGAPEPEPGFIPDETPPATEEPTPPESEEPTPAESEQPAPAGSETTPPKLPEEWTWGPGATEPTPPDDTAAPPAETEPPAENAPAESAPPDTVAAPHDIYGDTQITELPDTDNGQPPQRPVKPATTPPATETGSGEEETSPASEETRGENAPYTQFDLDQVPVAQVVIKVQPFREAILELVGGSGFNVVVGDDVVNTELALDFRNRAISLKRALDILCVAYDLVYTVDADAIIFRAKP